jgi:twitching motility protein PilU
MFPQDQHRQMYMDLSHYLRAIVSQRLVLGVDGKRVAAVEVMVNTSHVAELINRGDVGRVKEAFTTSSEQGMQTFDQALLALYKSGRISMEEALANADSRTNLEAQINFS